MGSSPASWKTPPGVWSSEGLENWGAVTGWSTFWFAWLGAPGRTGVGTESRSRHAADKMGPFHALVSYQGVL